MIIVDIETSGNFEPYKNGIWQIGAVEFDNPRNTFFGEGRIDEGDAVEEVALKVIGKTEQQLRNAKKQSQKELLENFFKWVEKINNKILVAQNVSFDYGFLFLRAKKYNLKFPFHYRSIDLPTIAFHKYFMINKKLPIEEGKNIFSLAKILEMCGMRDERVQMKENEVVKEGKPHNALEDAKLEAECLSRILYGKNVFPEFRNFPVPKFLKKFN